MSTTQPEPDSFKMFVGQIPKTMDEDELKEMMEEYGPVYQVGIIRDKDTSQSRGCAFVTFLKKADAMAAQSALHGLKVMPGLNNPIQMKPADGQITAVEERKLFVGMLPKTFSESDVAELFAPYGTVQDCSVLRDPSGQSKGCAFVVFSTKQSAQQAVRGMHHCRVMEGCKLPLVVKFADTPRDKEMKKMQNFSGSQHIMTGASGGFGMYSPQPQPPAMPMFNQPMIPQMFNQPMAPLNNPAMGATNPLAALAALGSLGLNAAQLQQVLAVAAVMAPLIQGSMLQQPPTGQSNAGLANLFASMNNSVAVSGTGTPVNTGHLSNIEPFQCNYGSANSSSSSTSLPHASSSEQKIETVSDTTSTTSVSTDLTSLPPIQSYSTYGSPVSQSNNYGSFSSQSNSNSTDLFNKAISGVQQFTAFTNQSSSSLAVSNSAAGSQTEGPEGANVFVYNLPEEFRDIDMLQLFTSFGTVVSAKVFVDKVTGQSKRFGFVSFDCASAAQLSIQAMNGFQIGNKRLKVQLKRSKSENKPYQKL